MTAPLRVTSTRRLVNISYIDRRRSSTLGPRVRLGLVAARHHAGYQRDWTHPAISKPRLRAGLVGQATWGDATGTNVVSRVVPACREFHTAVVEQRLTHDADPSLARHVANAKVKEDQAGTRIVKRNRGQKIDLAVASVIAYDRAHARRKPTTGKVGVENLEFYYAQV